MSAGGKRRPSIRYVLGCFLLLLLGGGTLVYFLTRSFWHLSGLTGFTLPAAASLEDYNTNIAFLDSSQSWLVRFPPGTTRPWEDLFGECEPSPDMADDYHYIRGMALAAFPETAHRFQSPRVWRGGHQGNCYIVSSDDGTLVFFHFFRT
jgi:hypothetical protein